MDIRVSLRERCALVHDRDHDRADARTLRDFSVNLDHVCGGSPFCMSLHAP